MSKSKLKHAVKRGAGKGTYLERQTEKKQAWTRNVYAFTQQETLDAASLVLHDLFGLGPERLKRLGDAFVVKFSEIQELNRNDKDDPDRVYSREKFEAAMKAAWGPYYEPREVRYDKHYIMEAPGKPVVDQ